MKAKDTRNLFVEWINWNRFTLNEEKLRTINLYNIKKLLAALESNTHVNIIGDI